jgi:NNP family nitrate/nitrite transporter-like MFS transporter
LKSQTANLLLATLAFALCFTAWSLIAPFAKTFKQNLGLDYTRALLLTAIPVVLGSLGRVPLGIVTDRYGGRLVFTLLLAFSALPAVLFGYAHAYWALLAVGFLLGIAGASFAVGVPFVSGWFSQDRQGFALGVYGIGNVGTAIAFFGAPPISNHWGRATVGWVVGIALLAGAALFYLLARNPPRRGAGAGYGAVLRAGWRLYRLAFFYFITFGGFVAMGFLLPTLLQDWFGYSKGEASARAAGFIIAATIARPVGGWVADRAGAVPVLVLAFAGIAVDAAVLATLAPDPRIVPVTIASLSLGAFLGSGSGAVFKLVPGEFPSNPGAAAGVVGAAGGLGGFFPPIYVGLVKDAQGTYTYGFVGLLVFVAVCLGIAVWLLRRPMVVA